MKIVSYKLNDRFRILIYANRNLVSKEGKSYGKQNAGYPGS